MNLFYQQFGSGQAFIILHGLFGSSDNWKTIGNALSKQFEVYLIDLRNHGRSFHDSEFSYSAMSMDIQDFILEKKLDNIILMGHSMGGKVAITFALQHPEKINKLIIVDVAPKYYAPHHKKHIDAFRSIDLNAVVSRKEVEDHFTKIVADKGERQLLLKNLYWTENDRLAWRLNVDAISDNTEELCKGQEGVSSIGFEKPTLFIKGENSNYIRAEDELTIKKLFPNSLIKSIPKAGHWLHAEKTQEFLDCILSFVE